MSEREFAAAIWPKVNGSSTMGGKKSTVCTIARSSLMRNTPASSALSKPTRTFGLSPRGSLPKTVSKNFGLSLDAQPAALTPAVSFILVLRLSFRRILAQLGHERLGGGRRGLLAVLEQFRGVHFFAVDRLIAVVIGLNHRAFQRDAAEQPARPRIGVDFRAGQGVGAGGGVASHGTSGGGEVAAHFKLVFGQEVDALAI